MRKTKWLRLFLFMCFMSATLHVNAQEQFHWVELTEENRYDSQYNMPIPMQSDVEQLDKAGMSNTQLSQLEDVLVEAWENFETSVDVSKFDLTASDSAYATYYFQILSRHPEIFYVRGWIGCTVSNDHVLKISISYDMESSEVIAIQKKVDAAVTEALSLVSDDMQDYEKALIIHDWLVNYCRYDYENLSHGTVPSSSYNAYGALAYGVAVCDGYTKAYQYIMESKLGIPCYRIASESMNHAWNLIEIDNQYYHIDATWDDPGSGITNECDRIGLVKHNNFLRSDAGITSTGHSGWETTVTASSTTYDEVGNWKNTSGQIIYHKGKWYYADNKKNAIVSTHNILNGENTSLYQFSTWKANTSGGYWPNAYSYPQVYRNKLFFNGPKSIYAMDFATNEVKELFVPEIQEDSSSEVYNIYGFDIKHDKLRYLVSSNANLLGTETIQEADFPSLGTLEGSVSVVGIVRYSNTLSANVSLASEITGELQYQWYRNGNPIEGAKEPIYTLVKADIGTIISVKVIVEEYSGELTEETGIVEKAIASAPAEPVVVSAFRGQTLAEIYLPSGYSWENNNIILDANGTKEYGMIYCPDEEIYSSVLGLKATVTTTCKTHEWDEGTVTKEATESEEGVKLYQCLYCSETKTEVLPKLEPTPDPGPDPTPDPEPTPDPGPTPNPGPTLDTKDEQEDDGEQDDEDDGDEEDEDDDTELEVGFTFTDDKTGNKYKITKVTDTKVEAAFVGNKSKKKKSITIPAMVEYEDITVKVTSIGKKALSNNISLKSVTIGKNVTSIGQNAFSGCKKLKTITIKSTKIKTFGKDCIKNIYKKATIKCQKSCKKNYTKKLTKKTGFIKQMKIK